MNTSGYRLPCECGEVIVVYKQQAGQSVTCETCGAAQDAPTLLGLKRLEQEPEDDAKRLDSDAGPKKSGGCLFSVALGGASVLLVVAAALFLLSLFWTPTITVESSLDRVNEQLDNVGPSDLLDFWDQVDHSGLGEAIPPGFVTEAKIAARLRTSAIVSCVLAGLAFLVSVALIIRDARADRA